MQQLSEEGTVNIPMLYGGKPELTLDSHSYPPEPAHLTKKLLSLSTCLSQGFRTSRAGEDVVSRKQRGSTSPARHSYDYSDGKDLTDDPESVVLNPGCTSESLKELFEKY